MSPIFITAMLGLVIGVAALSHVTPSVSNATHAKNIDTGLVRETALTQQIIRYKALEGTYPSTVADLVAKNYWRDADNDNGFGGSYSFTVDSGKNLVTISTTIADTPSRTKYLASYRRSFTPVDQGSNVVSTTFVMPSAGATGALPPPTGSIPAASTAPSATTNSYWYDTSGSTAVLKVSDGSVWTAATIASSGGSASGGGIAAPSASNIVASVSALPTTATTGDVRYVYNAATSSINTLFYYNGAWAQAGSGANAQVLTALAAQTLPLGRVASAFTYDFKAAVSAMFANTYGALTVDTSKVTWAAQGVLPAGLSLNAATGVLSGTPTVKTGPAGSTLNVLATYNGSSGQQSYLLQIGPTEFWVTSMAIGESHSCAVTTAGAAKCWGANYAGQLGDGTTAQRSSPTAVIGLTSGVESISAGSFHTCAVLNTDGVKSAKCWGRNTSGQLGDGTTVDKSSPTAVTGLTSGVESISAGNAHTCAVVNGAGKCWGSNNAGQLGNSSTVDSLSPVPVTGLSGMTGIAAGSNHTCAVASGAAKCWGSNADRALGNGGSASKPESAPVAVTGLTSGVTRISSGIYHSCAIFNASGVVGGVKCWGGNYNGQLGDGTIYNRSTPVAVSNISSGVTSISTNQYHSCAVVSGAAKCWGRNDYAQLGDGLKTTTYLPVDVFGLTNGVTGISAGGYYSCAFISNAAKCWGRNTSGQLGDTTTSDRTAPVDVLSEAW